MSKKIITIVVFLLALWTFGLAQDQAKPDQPKRDSIYFVKVAADVASNVQHETVDGAIGLYVSEQNWAGGLNDGDLGPLLSVIESKSGRSASCLLSQAKGLAVCVYFDGETPIGRAAVKAGANGRAEADVVKAAYKAVSKDELRKSGDELNFDPTDIAMDNGQQIPAFNISSKPKPKS